MVAKILGRIDYLGHTVSGRTYKKSYKAKRTHQNDRENWIITENTQEAIIDKETWERVQKLRADTKRKFTDLGEMGALNGLLYCADCGRRLRIQRDSKSKFQYYVCPTYMSSRTEFRECRTYNTPRHLIEPVILAEIQRITRFAKDHEKNFVALVEKTFTKVSDKELRTARNQLYKAEQRISELDVIIKKIYENNATGRLTDERFDKLYSEYEAEQINLNATAIELKSQINMQQQENNNIANFLKIVKKYTDVSELTSEIVRIFVEKIVCHQSNGKMGKNRRQQIDIYWNFIGLIEE